MGREALGKEGAERAFGGTVGLGDGRGVALGLDQQGRAEERADDAARQVGRRLGGLDEVLRDQGSGAGLAESVRRKAITSARCAVLARPAKPMRVPGMARLGAAMKAFSAS